MRWRYQDQVQLHVSEGDCSTTDGVKSGFRLDLPNLFDDLL
jgi:hypothetical protein